MDQVYEWIRNIIIYMILNTIIMNLLGNKSYKKYVSIVSGMILVLIVVSPLIKYMELEEILDYYLKSNDFAIEASDFKNDLNRMEEEQSNLIFEEYKKKIEQQVEEILLKEGVVAESIRITIDNNPKSDTFGELLQMDIVAGYEPTENEKGRVTVEEIVIGPIHIGEASENTKKKVPSPMEINIKKELSDFYNMKQDNINISIQGGRHG